MKSKINHDRFLLAIALPAGTLNARAATENQARILAGLLSNASEVESIQIHEETPKGLKLVLEIGR